MFTKENGNIPVGIVCCHVDDFLHAGEKEFQFVAQTKAEIPSW